MKKRVKRPSRPTSNPRARRHTVKRIRQQERSTGMAYDKSTFELMRGSAEAREWYRANQPRTFEAYLVWTNTHP